MCPYYNRWNAAKQTLGRQGILQMKTGSGKDKMLTLVGKGVSSGLAKGKAFVYIDVLQRDSELYHIDPAQVGEEQARIERAIADVRESLTIDAKHIEDQLDKKSE